MTAPSPIYLRRATKLPGYHVPDIQEWFSGHAFKDGATEDDCKAGNVSMMRTIRPGYNPWPGKQGEVTTMNRSIIRMAHQVANDYMYKAVYDRKTNSVLVACTLDGKTEIIEYPGGDLKEALQEAYNAIVVRCKRMIAGA